KAWKTPRQFAKFGEKSKSTGAARMHQWMMQMMGVMRNCLRHTCTFDNCSIKLVALKINPELPINRPDGQAAPPPQGRELTSDLPEGKEIPRASVRTRHACRVPIFLRLCLHYVSANQWLARQ